MKIRKYFFRTEDNSTGMCYKLFDTIYFSTFMTEGLKITEALKTKYDFEVILIRSSSRSYHKLIGEDFLKAVKNSEKLQDKIVEKGWIFETREDLLEEVDRLLWVIEHPECLEEFN